MMENQTAKSGDHDSGNGELQLQLAMDRIGHQRTEAMTKQAIHAGDFRMKTKAANYFDADEQNRRGPSRFLRIRKAAARPADLVARNGDESC